MFLKFEIPYDGQMKIEHTVTYTTKRKIFDERLALLTANKPLELGLLTGYINKKPTDASIISQIQQHKSNIYELVDDHRIETIHVRFHDCLISLPMLIKSTISGYLTHKAFKVNKIESDDPYFEHFVVINIFRYIEIKQTLDVGTKYYVKKHAGNTDVNSYDTDWVTTADIMSEAGTKLDTPYMKLMRLQYGKRCEIELEITEGTGVESAEFMKVAGWKYNIIDYVPVYFLEKTLINKDVKLSELVELLKSKDIEYLNPHKIQTDFHLYKILIVPNNNVDTSMLPYFDIVIKPKQDKELMINTYNSLTATPSEFDLQFSSRVEPVLDIYNNGIKKIKERYNKLMMAISNIADNSLYISVSLELDGYTINIVEDSFFANHLVQTIYKLHPDISYIRYESVHQLVKRIKIKIRTNNYVEIITEAVKKILAEL
jgi:DNA-directed RNA polymerase subunit L